jgi:N6-adenosine-specific RNA methylase IME4
VRFKTIVSDPAWSYGNRNCNGAAEREYPTMSIDQICALKVKEVAHDDCVLLLWTTWPMLQDSFKVIDAWGFEYVTGLPWVKADKAEIDLWGEWHIKTQFGVGFWFRGVTEPILVCRRGKPKLPDETWVGLLSPNIRHSRKPDNIYQIAESLEGPYLEMFARRKRDGWASFGNEIEGGIAL